MGSQEPPVEMNQKRPTVEVSRVSKRYCRNFKRSLWYGLQDLSTELTGGRHDRYDTLRKGEFLSLNDVSFHVDPGECIALLGPNGAGKSTMMKLLNGLLKPNHGKILIRGRVGALIELGVGFNPMLSGRDNVFINGVVLGMKRREIERRFDEIVAFAQLEEVIDAPVKTYSSGMRVRLGYSVAAHLRPNLLLLDEVLAVGDVGFRMKCFDHLVQLREQGTSIILVSHALAAIQHVAQRAVVFGKGSKVFDGDLDEGIARYQELVGAKSASEPGEDPNLPDVAEIESVVSESVASGNSDIQTGDMLRVRVRIHVKQPVSDARVVLNLVSPSTGRLASISSAAQQLQLDLLEPVQELEIEFPNLPLLCGHYSFNVGLYGATNAEFLDRKMNVGAFNVIGPAMGKPGFSNLGIVDFEHRWKAI